MRNGTVTASIVRYDKIGIVYTSNTTAFLEKIGKETKMYLPVSTAVPYLSVHLLSKWPFW